MADELDKLRKQIYEELKAMYKADSESLSEGGKAIMAIFATSAYMDHYDALGDMFADMDRRLQLAERVLIEMKAGTYKGAGNPSNIITDLVPLDMIETAEGYSGMTEMVDRMKKVSAENIHYSINEYEKQNGLTLTVWPDQNLESDDFDSDADVNALLDD